MHKALSAVLAILSIAAAAPAAGGAWAEAGDLGLRHDLQLLVDGGVFNLPTTTWPIPWRDIAGELERTSDAKLTEAQAAAAARLRSRLQTASREGATAAVGAAGAEQPVQMRGFADTPREDAEIGGNLTWQANRFSMRATVTAVANASDGKDVRFDGSYVGGLWGNVLISAGFIDKWWGPGYDGSLILSNDARPVPAITIERASSAPFKTRWLSWLGPVRAIVTFGQLEGDRNDAPHAGLFGLRVAAKPLPQLEIAASRTAQLCGEGRPCGLGTWWDMLTGVDNNQPLDQQPGNQLGGFDVRWAFRSIPLALYVQAIGEDEANFMPSKYLGLLGAETWGGSASYSWRAYLEYANTACDFTRSEQVYGCAYESSIYTDGYLHRGRPIGHAADRDAELVSGGVVLLTHSGTWTARVMGGQLNRGGLSYPRPHTWSQVPADYLGAWVGWSGGVAGLRADVQGGWQQVTYDGGGDDSDPQFSLRITKDF